MTELSIIDYSFKVFIKKTLTGSLQFDEEGEENSRGKVLENALFYIYSMLFDGI